jgi:phosphonate transport system substrate-binding protein
MTRHRFINMFILICFLLTPMAVSAEEELLIGLIPEENIFRQIKKHKPLGEYLMQRLGIKVRFTILSRYPEIIKRFVDRELDGAFFGIFTAVLAEERLGVMPVARIVSLDGSTTAKSYIFTRKDTGIRNASDMKGRRVAFVDKVTATGYLYGIAYLRESGIPNPDSYFSEYFFAGGHDTTVYTVLSGRADVGTVKGRILEKIRLKDPVIKDEIEIIARSGELPDNTLCLRGDLDPELTARLRNVLLTMHEDSDGRQVLEALEAKKFISAASGDFGPVKNLARKAGINLRTFTY